MNILMISDVYFPRVNGVSTSIATFRKQLMQQGHQVCLIVPDYQQDSIDDPDIIRIPSRHLWLDPEDRMLRTDAIYALEAELRNRSFDVLHIQTPFLAHHAGIRLAGKLGLPVIESYHTYFEEYLYHYVPFLPRTMMRAAARYFTRIQCNQLDAVIVPSHAMQTVLEQYGVTTATQIIPTGLEMELFTGGSGSRFRELHAIEAKRPTLVHIGRVAHEKNIDFLLDVLVRLRKDFSDILLVIAGEGPARKALRARVRHEQLEYNVLLVDYLPRGPRLWDCFLAGDLFVFASSTETQGLVLLEAMALGVPVVSTAEMGTRDIVLAERGCRVAATRADDFALQVSRLLRDPAARGELSRQARAFAAEWSAEALACQLAGYYARLADAFAANPDKRTGSKFAGQHGKPAAADGMEKSG